MGLQRAITCEQGGCSVGAAAATATLWAVGVRHAVEFLLAP